MGYVRALLNYMKEGKGRRDALDYLKTVGIMMICMVCFRLILFMVPFR
jgi:hypothetical protein